MSSQYCVCIRCVCVYRWVGVCVYVGVWVCMWVYVCVGVCGCMCVCYSLQWTSSTVLSWLKSWSRFVNNNSTSWVKTLRPLHLIWCDTMLRCLNQLVEVLEHFNRFHPELLSPYLYCKVVTPGKDSNPIFPYQTNDNYFMALSLGQHGSADSRKSQTWGPHNEHCPCCRTLKWLDTY